jgi:hypothetical protein
VVLQLPRILSHQDSVSKRKSGVTHHRLCQFKQTPDLNSSQCSLARKLTPTISSADEQVGGSPRVVVIKCEC